jgi:hypothetical protein|nr:MAG TPA: CCDC85 family protein [Bacteriophage sp.]
MIVKVSLNDARKTIKEYENLGYLHIGTVRTIDGITLSFRDPIVPEENHTTDIQFHEGDFVENKDGKIGYISSICHCDECKRRGFFEPTITYSDGTTDYISNYSVKTISSDYKQIGIQKFSTEDILRNKIAALEKENKELTEKVNHLTERNHELLDLCCFYDMERNDK